MQVSKSIHSPIRSELDWNELWKAADQGLIACWERGRMKAQEDPALVIRAKAGHLPVLPWKGGHEKRTKVPLKYGSLNYLAMWQGLRGEDLNVELQRETPLTCASTGMLTLFTGDQAKFAEE